MRLLTCFSSFRNFAITMSAELQRASGSELPVPQKATGSRHDAEAKNVLTHVLDSEAQNQYPSLKSTMLEKSDTTSMAVTVGGRDTFVPSEAGSRKSKLSRRSLGATDYFPKPDRAEVNIPFRLSPRSGFIESRVPPPPHVDTIDDNRTELVVENAKYTLAEIGHKDDGPIPGWKVPEPENALFHWRAVFKNLDLAQDGFIDKDELRHLLAQIGHVPPERDLDVMLALTNPKTPGRVTL